MNFKKSYIIILILIFFPTNPNAGPRDEISRSKKFLKTKNENNCVDKARSFYLSVICTIINILLLTSCVVEDLEMILDMYLLEAIHVASTNCSNIYSMKPTKGNVCLYI